MSESAPDPGTGLVRVIGRWGLTALVVNGIIGSGIFGLPAPLAAVLGPKSPWAVLLAALAMGVIAGCYAEVASRFTATGGTYLYVRQALGRFAGLQIAWMSLLVRLAAAAASLNLLVGYLAEFWPGVTEPLSRFVTITAVTGVLTLINCRGTGAGAGVSSATATVKVAALAAICIAGAAYVLMHPVPERAQISTAVAGWLRALLLLFFSYGGYEIALVASGEARNPKRDAPFAIFAGLGVVTVLYTLLQLTVMRVVADPAHSARPLADAARALMGNLGAGLMSVAAIVSVCGFLSATLLAMPRNMYALATEREFPAWFARVHPHFRTPCISIGTFAFFTWIAALFGSFAWNVTLSAVARLLYFAAVCACVPALRRQHAAPAPFRLPGGATLPAAGVVVCMALLTQIDFTSSFVLAATFLAASLNWLVTRRQN